MLIILIISTILGVCSPHWAIIWLCLEINTLIICYLLRKENLKKKYLINNPIHYFVVQIISSSIILLRVNSDTRVIKEITICIIILVKIGRWPTHIWFIRILNKLNSRKINFLILCTWQKIIPLYFLQAIELSSPMIIILFSLALGNILSPAIILKENISLKNTLMVSSLRNNGWLILRSIASTKLLFRVLFIYSLSLFLALHNFKRREKISKRREDKQIQNLLTIANLSGLPPFSMFWVKVIVLKFIIKIQASAMVNILLILCACIILYLYIKTLTSEIMRRNKKNQFLNNLEKSTKVKILVTLSSLISFILRLGYTERVYLDRIKFY